MIKSKDLRLGNYINQKFPMQVIHFSYDEIYADFKGNKEGAFKFASGDIEGIFLNEKWLLKFGFERFPWGLVKGKLLFKDNLNCKEIIFVAGNGFRKRIKYVHELQNIYFALTGKELVIKK